MALAVRVDLRDTLRHDLDLCATHVLREGVDLPVGIGDADIIVIDQGNLADAGECQLFGRPGADPADADHADVHGL